MWLSSYNVSRPLSDYAATNMSRKMTLLRSAYLWTVAAAIAMLASAEVLTASVSGQESCLEQATRAGLAAYKQGDDARAESWFRLALKESEKLPAGDPNLPKALHNLAMVL